MTTAQAQKRQAKIARRREQKPAAYEAHQLRTSGIAGIRMRFQSVLVDRISVLPRPANEPPARPSYLLPYQSRIAQGLRDLQAMEHLDGLKLNARPH